MTLQSAAKWFCLLQFLFVGAILITKFVIYSQYKKNIDKLDEEHTKVIDVLKLSGVIILTVYNCFWFLYYKKEIFTNFNAPAIVHCVILILFAASLFTDKAVELVFNIVTILLVIANGVWSYRKLDNYVPHRA